MKEFPYSVASFDTGWPLLLDNKDYIRIKHRCVSCFKWTKAVSRFNYRPIELLSPRLSAI